MAKIFAEQTLTIENNEYSLIENSYKNDFQYHDIDQGYQQLNHRAKTRYNRTTINTPLITEHQHTIRAHVPPQLTEVIISEFNKDKESFHKPEVLKSFIAHFMTDEVDEHIRSYFNSEYCIMWWAVYKIEKHNEDEFYYTKWHCDGGPTRHLKMITYLNGYDEHGSETAILDHKTSTELKKVGYIFNNVAKRSIDIKPLCDHFNIDFSPEFFKANAGDTLIFNPNQLAHRATPPMEGKTRYALTFCIVPSEVSWKTIAEKYFFPAAISLSFDGFPEVCKKFTQHQQKSDELIEFPLNNIINNVNHLYYLLDVIINDNAVAKMFADHINEADPEFKQFNSLFELLKFIKQAVIEQIKPDNITEESWPRILNNICQYERTYIDSCSRYNINKKPDPKGVFWPNPLHDKHPVSKFDLLPYVKKEPVMDMNTPIGSAGSCFAFEIAKHFQEAGYNYVITERNDNVNSGVVIDGYQPGDTIAKFCANYGILFNTPSFKQLAEKAFGIKKFEKLLFASETGHYLDPYRENVFFNSQEAYLADYERHIEAVKEAFLSCEVFVVTLGLNECWELHDGTVMSRNPRNNTYQCVKHKTLTVEENVHNIQTFFDIIKANNPKFKLIISVSPIPFLATGRADEQHIISANCHSKAVLRVAADQLVTNNPDMYYLPSYEMVTECCKDAWDEDSRHVTPETVAKVVAMFKEIFVTDI